MATPRRESPPRTTIIFVVVWNLVLGSILVASIARDSAWWMLPFFLSPALLMLVVVLWRRRRSSTTVLGKLTGRVLTRPPAHLTGGHFDPRISRWVGGGSFPSWLGRMEASTPLAILEITGSSMSFRVRPRILAVMFGITPLVATIGELQEVFPASRALRVGIALRALDGRAYYLWTANREEILATLEAAQFPVSWEERRIDRR